MRDADAPASGAPASGAPASGNPGEPQPAPKKTGLQGWLLILVLMSMLAASAYGLIDAFQDGKLPHISMHGWIAMSLGTLISLVLGCGLMWLSFYSARQGFDERADPGRIKIDPAPDA